jgi:hypothetical protein
MNDTHGRPYARLSELRPGDWIEVYAGFSCMSSGEELVVETQNGELFVSCYFGEHFLRDELADDGNSLIGMYRVAAESAA